MPFQFLPPTQIEGETDNSGRPFIEVTLHINGRKHVLRPHIDTGCDADLLVVSHGYAVATLGLAFRPKAIGGRVTQIMADGSRVDFLVAKATLDWFGFAKPVSILTPEPDPDAPPPDPKLKYDDKVLIGLPVFNGCSLGVEFINRPGNVIVNASQPLLSNLAQIFGRI